MPISIEEFNNESWFKISDHDSLRPFFMSIVSDSNHWMFISSNGGLTAGRKNAEYALFPYYTDDKIHELAHTTGSKSIFRVKSGKETKVWEPFSEIYAFEYDISRNLYKNQYGNKIMFEEINHDLDLIFRYQWNSSNNFGFVRKSSLINSGSGKSEIEILDGIQNIMPYGVSSDLQTRASNLVDAYKRCELVEDTGLGVYALSAIIVDKAEPSEALKANVAWSAGIDEAKYLLSSIQLDDFRKDGSISPEKDIKGEKGAYFIHSVISLDPSEEKNWSIIANVNQDQSNVVKLNKSIKEDPELFLKVYDDVEQGTDKLISLVAGADGLQQTADPLKDTRHYSNVLFNIMRGGIFDNNYLVEKEDFTNYLETASKGICERNKSFIDALDVEFDKNHLKEKLRSCKDPDLQRLGKEYLPLKFSRRHGDPSRPWNKFSINTHSEIDGSKILDYEGNWRDIFQNWEALVHSYPDFVEGMIFKFLNATTFDGYNPYRVTKDGFDWETIEPDDPWSYIGYWGDHQIIYLLKFLEFYNKYQAEGISKLFDQDVFVYANVPYRIKSYKDIVRDPKDTIEFDESADQAIRKLVEKKGGDGALLGSNKENIHRVNFLEKILATVLAKVSNFIPEGGIWMNTQRPEWNDANNALVGNGVSMVTLYYLRRFLKFLEPVIEQAGSSDISLSEELGDFFNGIKDTLESNRQVLNGNVSAKDRKSITDGLGMAGSNYRNKIYKNGFSGTLNRLNSDEILDFIRLTLEYLEHSIEANKRDDDLYHAYNLMSTEGDNIRLSYLDEMLEGQVAVLSSGYLSSGEALKVLDALKESALYREDQQSYILYPNKDLPGFLERNDVPDDLVNRSELLRKLLRQNDRRIINKDVEGGYHFNGNFKNAGDLKKALRDLKSAEYKDLAKKEETLILGIFEEVFNHKAFTGRSGTFFGYEGLGSIYWHMVSKLHLAVMEICKSAEKEQADERLRQQLSQHFDEIGEGIGVHKEPELYGAFPTDPYSHTPQYRGAQQPGMTGQVKEDVLVRFGELGIHYVDGKLNFSTGLLKKDEFISESRTFEMRTNDHRITEIVLPDRSLAFTCCQTPVVYKLGDSRGIKIDMTDGSSRENEDLYLDRDLSNEIFKRTGRVKQLTVSLKAEDLRSDGLN